MDSVWPFLMVIPSQSISLVKNKDFSALTKIPAFLKASRRCPRSWSNSVMVSAARARSSMCVAILGLSSWGMILLRIVEET